MREQDSGERLIADAGGAAPFDAGEIGVEIGRGDQGFGRRIEMHGASIDDPERLADSSGSTAPDCTGYALGVRFALARPQEGANAPPHPKEQSRCPHPPRKPVAELVVDFLVARGVDRWSSACKAVTSQPIWDQLGQRGVRIVDVRDEGGRGAHGACARACSSRRGRASRWPPPGRASRIA
jgi:hypothetical protein